MSFIGALSVASALALAGLAVGLTAVGVADAAAQTLNVNTTADGHQGSGSSCSSPAAGGACTLRAAIELADKSSGDTIVVPAGTYVLDAVHDVSLNVLRIDSSMTITGAGASSTIVDGSHVTGVLAVISTTATVAISGLTIRNGFDAGVFSAGAGIANDGTLSLTDVVVSGNSAPTGFGGGIASDGPLTLSNVVVSGNEAGDSGGLALLGTVKTTITRSTISNNTADGVLVRNRDFSEFHLAGHGGGIALFGGDGAPPPSVAITGTAITGNTVTGETFSDPSDFPQGGGIFNFAGALSLANDTVAGNTATKTAGGPNLLAVGGGIDQTDQDASTPVSSARTNSPRAPLSVLVPRLRAAEAAGFDRPGTAHATSHASTTLDFVTLAGNGAELFGGIGALAGKFTATNSIVAVNTGGNCGNPGAVTSTGYNVESGSDCGFRQTGDQSSVDPKLDALKVNPPGATATVALLPGSPAIDAADPHCDQGVDQRGVTRPQGPRCDIGAFEVAQASPITPVPSPPVTGMRWAAISDGGLAAAIVALMAVAALAALGVTRRRGGSASRAR